MILLSFFEENREGNIIEASTAIKNGNYYSKEKVIGYTLKSRKSKICNDWSIHPLEMEWSDDF